MDVLDVLVLMLPMNGGDPFIDMPLLKGEMHVSGRQNANTNHVRSN